MLSTELFLFVRRKKFKRKSNTCLAFVSYRSKENKIIMKLAFMLLIVVLSQKCYHSKSFISEAISEFVNQYYVKKWRRFDFIIDSNSTGMTKIIDSTLKRVKASESYEVLNVAGSEIPGNPVKVLIFLNQSLLASVS